MRSYENKLSVVPPLAEVAMTVKEVRDPWSISDAIEATEPAIIGGQWPTMQAWLYDSQNRCWQDRQAI
jgi:hypothetical protein